MIASWQISADWLRRAVRQQHTAIVSKHRISNCRIDANARRATREDEVFDPQSAESLVEFRFSSASWTQILRCFDPNWAFRPAAHPMRQLCSNGIATHH